ncbi:MAG: hypothetical protein ABUT39_20585, partial [Acidobacteriota bacterium]
DPLGFRVFELLQAAVEEAVSSGALYILAGDRKIRNNTLLGFHPAAEQQSSPADLEPIVHRWNDELMPALITARTRQQTALIRQLRERILGLPGRGVEAFQFKDLLDPLKRDARRRWAAILEEGKTGSVASSSDAVQAPEPGLPGSAAESRASFKHLTRCVSTSIDRMEADSRTRTQLMTLWHYLWRQHGDESPEAVRPPSYRQLGQRLNIPRERLPALFALLRQLVPRGLQ